MGPLASQLAIMTPVRDNHGMQLRLSIIMILALAPLAAAQTPSPAPRQSVAAAKGLSCRGGKKVEGPENGWSPRSTCPEGYVVTGLQRLDLLGNHAIPTLHVNDLICDDLGCKAWCIGSACTVEARCCR